MEAVLDISAAEVTLQQAGRRDLAELARLYVELSPDYTIERAAEKVSQMLSGGHGAVIMRHGEVAIGSILWMDMGDHVFIRNYVIVGGYRRAGLGSGLFARLKAELLPAKPIRLEASEDGARTFWGKQGFALWSTGMRNDL
ncbi:MAG: GNAT family N-acetyltransferase [Pseudomonadota bacterium]